MEKNSYKGYQTLILTLFGGTPKDLLPIEERVIEKINRALAALNPQDEKVIRMRFGLDGEKQTLQQIARKLDVSPTGVWRAQKRGLRKLRHPARVKIMGGLIFFHDSLLDRVEYLEKENEWLEIENQSLKISLDNHQRLLTENKIPLPPDASDIKKILASNPVFGITIRDSDLSMRVKHRLHIANIKTILDLVLRAETSLLKLENFGQKSLKEVKRFIISKGLTLGMKYPNEFRQYLQPRQY